MNFSPFIADSSKFRLKDHDPAFTGKYQNKEEVTRKTTKDLGRLGKLQEMLYAQNTQGVVLIFQAMDAAGKDSTVKR